jgi:hypothetical protein
LTTRSIERRPAPLSLRKGEASQARSRAIIPFPAERVARRPPPPAAKAATVRTVPLRGWFRRWLLWAIGPPARQCIEIDAVCTGQCLSVWVGEHYVRLSIDGQDYYFDRVTGRFDGMGASP